MNRKQLIDQFVAEAREHISRMEGRLVDLEADPAAVEIVHDIFQGVHGIKGTSDYTGLGSINRTSHAMETLLNRLRKGQLESSPGVVDEILRGVDLLKRCLANVDDAEHAADQVDVYRRSLEQLTAAAPEPVPAPDRKPVPEDALLAAFRRTSRQHMEALQMAAAKLEGDGEPGGALEILRRTVRTFANSAGYLGLEDLRGLLDGLALRFRDVSAPGARDRAALAQAVLDIEGALESLDERPTPEPPSQQDAPAVVAQPADESDQTVRVPMRKLDDFINLVSELVVARNALAHLMHTVRQQQIGGAVGKQVHQLSLDINKITERLQSQVMSIRLVSIRSLMDRFPRIVRDLARNHQREIRLVRLGEDNELDKGVAELLHEPLVHLVRNAVAHGIETPEERRAADKPPTGTITLRAEHEGSFISLEVTDDGKGLDLDSVARSALREKKVTQADLDEMSPREVANLIFLPAVSTSAHTDGLSGRGVGLDAVNANVRRFGGNVQVDWEPGKGCRFLIKIPLTLAVVQTLVVESGGQRFAVPASFVTENLNVGPERISRLNNLKTIVHDGEPVPLLELDRLLGLPGAEAREREVYTTMIIRHGAQRVGLVVDRILQQLDALVRPLSSDLANLNQFSGATVTSDGSLILILNPAGLLTRG